MSDIRLRRAYPRDRLLFAAVSLLGLTFWFALGFPFANHNESFRWVAEMRGLSGFNEVLRWSPAVTYRPLGSLTAWATYALSGEIYLQQAVNFALTALAWLILYFAVEERKLFACIALLTGGVFFSGYIYLFHLHGVFYGPLLIFVALLTRLGIRSDPLTLRGLAWLFALTVVTALYHPFALLIFVAFTAGLLLERRTSGLALPALSAVFIVAAYLLLKLLVTQQDAPPPAADWFSGMSSSYRLAELNAFFGVLSWLLAIAALWSFESRVMFRAAGAALITAACATLAVLHLPLLFVWLAACLLKTLVLRKWSLGAVLLTTAVLPVATGTGTSTYVVFALMVCSATTAVGWPFLETNSVIHRVVAVGLIVAGLLTAVLIRAEVRLPLVSSLVRPIMAEREKTFQLESVVQWLGTSGYSDHPLALCEPADIPVGSKNVVDRKYRAPTGQSDLDRYVDSMVSSPAPGSGPALLVCFGEQPLADAERLHQVPGPYNGAAVVYLPHATSLTPAAP